MLQQGKIPWKSQIQAVCTAAWLGFSWMRENDVTHLEHTVCCTDRLLGWGLQSHTTHSRRACLAIFGTGLVTFDTDAEELSSINPFLVSLWVLFLELFIYLLQKIRIDNNPQSNINVMIQHPQLLIFFFKASFSWVLWGGNSHLHHHTVEMYSIWHWRPCRSCSWSRMQQSSYWWALMYTRLNWLSILFRVQFKILVITFKAVLDSTLEYIQYMTTFFDLLDLCVS